MRTLKKSLCLVLAVVMILGLGAFNVNAQYTTKDYSDAAKISHGEAVDVLGTIGVLEGDDNDGDGKIDYRPEDKLTRAQATKIITSMLGVTAVTAVAPFADVDASVAWAKDYIAYCAEQGIVEGVDDENNLFDPQGELTGGAFAKMLLTAMGYDAAIEGMAGTTSWMINVAKLVRNNNLDRGIENFPYDEAINRNDAAQLAFNALCAPLVGYDNKGGSMNVNGVTITTAPTTAHYMTTTVRDTQTISSALVNDGSSSGTYIVEFAEKYQPKLVRVTQDEDKFGRPCTTWTYNRAKIDTYPSDDLRVAQWNGKYTDADAYKAIGGDLMRRLGNNTDNKYMDFKVFEDGEELEYSKGLKDYFESWKTNDDDKNSGAGVITEVYVDDDVYYGDDLSHRYTVVTVVVINTWLGEVVSAKNSKGEAKVAVYGKFNNIQDGPVITVKEEDVSNIGDFREDDKVLVQISNPTDNDKRAIEVIMAPKILTDKTVSVYTADSRSTKDIYGNEQDSTAMMDSVTIEGVKYPIAYKAMWNTDVLHAYTVQKLKDFTYDVYLDQFNNAIGINTNNDATDYVFVTGLQTSSSIEYVSSSETYKAGLIFTDGEMKTSATVKMAKKDDGSALDYFNSLRYRAYKGEKKDFDEMNPYDAAGAVQDYKETYDGRSWMKTYEGSTNDKGLDGAIVNRWFTYTKDENNVITLHDVVGTYKGSNDVNKNKFQSAYTFDDGDEINSTHRLLSYYGGAAVGNDKSVYIPVKLSDDVKGGIISEVVGSPIVGIRNASILVKDIAYDSWTAYSAGKTDEIYNNFAIYTKDEGIYNTYTDPTDSGRQWNNVYFMYDSKTNAVLYAVVVADSNVKDILYITSDQVTQREYIKGIGYVDSYDVIMNGKKVTVKVDEDASGTQTKKGYRGLYKYAEKDGYLTKLDRIEVFGDDQHDLNTELNKKNAFAGIRTFGSDLVVEGNTISFKDAAGQYLYVDNDTKYFVADNPGGADDYKEYSSASSAKSAAVSELKDPDTEYVYLYAECDGETGVAKFVVLETNSKADSAEFGARYVWIERSLNGNKVRIVPNGMSQMLRDGDSAYYIVTDTDSTKITVENRDQDKPISVTVYVGYEAELKGGKYTYSVDLPEYGDSYDFVITKIPETDLLNETNKKYEDDYYYINANSLVDWNKSWVYIEVNDM